MATAIGIPHPAIRPVTTAIENRRYAILLSEADEARGAWFATPEDSKLGS
jgi:hypothetical protein